MTCSLPDDPAWSAWLEPRARLDAGATALVFARRHGAWSCTAGDAADTDGAEQVLLVEVVAGAIRARPPAAAAVASCRVERDGLVHVEAANGRAIDPGFVASARVYLPVLLGATAARRAGRSFVVGHVTQTLDGRIACENGQSQWIGNDADLHHAHRMRALLDGVLVGATTALRDDPQLTVRHVQGRDPRRVVLSGSGRVLRDGRALKLMQEPGCEVVVAVRPDAPVDTAAHVTALPGVDARLAPAAVLDALRARGLSSLYLEGGAGTLSSFLQAGCIDVLQVHIAPIVLGSGVPSVCLPPIDHVREGLRLRMDHVVLDGHVLLTCVAERTAP